MVNCCSLRAVLLEMPRVVSFCATSVAGMLENILKTKFSEKYFDATDALAAAVGRIHETIEFLDRNPNETLQIQALLLALPSL